MSPLAATTVLAPKLGQFARDYPGVVLEVTTEESRINLIAAAFGAGIHFGEFIEQDVPAVPRLLPRLSESAAATSGALCTHRDRTIRTLS